MLRRTPWWTIALAGVAAIVGLLAPTHGGIGLSNYGRELASHSPLPLVSPAVAAPQVDRGLVLINTNLSYQGAVGAGTGIVLDPNGEVLTNNHVVEGATQITATSIATGQSYPVNVIGYDRKHDIALVQLQGANGLPVAPIGNSSQVAVGDPIVAVGNAGGQGLSHSQGTVTGLNQTIVASDQLASAEQLTGTIETNANLRPGDSGGALVDSSGKVVGVNTAASDNYRLSGRRGAQGFAIPIETAMSIASQIRSGNASGSVHIGETAFLGVGVADAQGQGGVPVRQVLRGSPADQAGIAPGDVITGFNGSAVNSDTALTDLLDQQYPGNSVSMTWLDPSGQQHSADVALAAGPVG